MDAAFAADGCEVMDAAFARDGCEVMDPAWILHLPLGLHELQVPPVAAPNPKESPVALGEEVARAEEARRTHPGTPSAALNDAARGRPWAELQAFKPIA